MLYIILEKADVKGYERKRGTKIHFVKPYSRTEKVQALQRQIHNLVSKELETGKDVKYKGEAGWRINERGTAPGTWSIYKLGQGVLKEVPATHLSVHSRLEKAKKVYVPGTAKRKAYYRYDPRTGKYHKLPHATVIYHEKSTGEKIIETLKKILTSIKILKKKGMFTKEQKAHIRRALKGLEPKLEPKRFKSWEQREAVSKVLGEIRKELYAPVPKAKPKAKLSDEILRGVKALGYSQKDIDKMSEHEAKAVYYNDIRKE